MDARVMNCRRQCELPVSKLGLVVVLVLVASFGAGCSRGVSGQSGRCGALARIDSKIQSRAAAGAPFELRSTTSIGSVNPDGFEVQNSSSRLISKSRFQWTFGIADLNEPGMFVWTKNDGRTLTLGKSGSLEQIPTAWASAGRSGPKDDVRTVETLIGITLRSCIEAGVAPVIRSSDPRSVAIDFPKPYWLDDLEVEVVAASFVFTD